MKKSKNRQVYEQNIHRIQDYISAHLDQDLNLEQLAKISVFSPFHFHRIFKSIVGETPYDFIQRTRLEKSCAMLTANPEMKIIHIAMRCGFSTPSSFSKAFKKYFEVSPSEYREAYASDSKNGTPERNPGKATNAPVGYSTDSELEELFNRRKEMNVQIEMLPEYRVAYMRQIGPYGADNLQLMQKLKKWAITRDLLTESSVILGIAHDDPDVTPPQKCRYDCCMVISNAYELDIDINDARLPGGKYAVIAVEHTAEAIGKAWHDAFTVWLPDSGYQIDDRPLFERYQGAAQDIKIEPAFCEICIPLKKL